MQVFDVVSKMQIKTPCMEPFVMQCAMSPDCSKIATGGMRNLVKIWDCSGTKPIAKAELVDPVLEAGSHDGYVAQMHFIEGGKKLLTGSGDGTVKMWDVETKKLEVTFIGHQADVSGVAICDGKSIFGTSSTDKHVRMWDWRAPPLAFRKFQAKYSTNCCTMLADGQVERAVAASPRVHATARSY